MATDDRLNETISRWLEEAAPDRLPERTLDATFERTRGRRQHVGWRALLGRFRLPRILPVLGAAAVVVVAAAVALEFYGGFAGIGAPTLQPATHEGSWESNDPPPESSHLTMDIIELSDGTFDVTIRDDAAAVCSGASSTMTGIAEAGPPGTIVIAQPMFACDDGSEPQALIDVPLEDLLRDLAFTYDVDKDVIQDSGGLVWTRVGAGSGGEPVVERTPAPAASEFAGSTDAFPGSWEATDGPPDNSHLTMDIAELSDGTYDVTILDDAASVCSGASSTMTGVAEEAAPGTIVIERPVYVCDDGSRPKSLSGPTLDEQLANLTFDHVEHDTLGDSLGLIWTRVAMDP